MPFASPFADVEIPAQSLTEFVLEGGRDRRGHPALIDGPTGRTLTHGDVADGIAAAAGALTERGIGRGDVVAILSPNAPEYAIAFHAIASVGAAATTINPVYTRDEVAHQLRHSGAKAVVSPDGAGAEVPGISYDDLLAGDPAAAPAVRPDPGDVVALPYSSGTTGLPKGVMLSHRNLVANVLQATAVQPVERDDTLAGVLPLFHIYGMSVVMNGVLRQGATVVLMPRFDLEQFLGLIEEHRITKAHLVPPIILALAKHPAVEGRDLSSLKLINSGAAPLSAELAAAAAERVGCPVVQGYGMTETSPVTHTTPIDPAANRPGSIGPAIPNTEFRFVDTASGEEAAEGELCIRGPQVMLGYLNDEESTRNTIDADGWLHTGDVGRADGDGYVYLVDRVKELIKYKGFQVAPAELEAILVEHPAVADAAVVASPDEEAGEVPKAFVVLSDPTADTDEIRAFVAEKVAHYKRLRRFEVVDAIPKSASGKILRRELIERERAQQGA
ncbi:MAG: AMP-binding protein [Actinomycetota bacterium]|nr:AMP-binding protein [Actinomycetota bacterium]